MPMANERRETKMRCVGYPMNSNLARFAHLCQDKNIMFHFTLACLLQARKIDRVIEKQAERWTVGPITLPSPREGEERLDGARMIHQFQLRRFFVSEHILSLTLDRDARHTRCATGLGGLESAKGRTLLTK